MIRQIKVSIRPWNVCELIEVAISMQWRRRTLALVCSQFQGHFIRSRCVYFKVTALQKGTNTRSWIIQTYIHLECRILISSMFCTSRTSTHQVRTVHNNSITIRQKRGVFRYNKLIHHSLSHCIFHSLILSSFHRTNSSCHLSFWICRC